MDSSPVPMTTTSLIPSHFLSWAKGQDKQWGSEYHRENKDSKKTKTKEKNSASNVKKNRHF